MATTPSPCQLSVFSSRTAYWPTGNGREDRFFVREVEPVGTAVRSRVQDSLSSVPPANWDYQVLMIRELIIFSNKSEKIVRQHSSLPTKTLMQ